MVRIRRFAASVLEKGEGVELEGAGDIDDRPRSVAGVAKAERCAMDERVGLEGPAIKNISGVSDVEIRVGGGNIFSCKDRE